MDDLENDILYTKNTVQEHGFTTDLVGYLIAIESLEDYKFLICPIAPIDSIYSVHIELISYTFPEKITIPESNIRLLKEAQSMFMKSHSVATGVLNFILENTQFKEGYDSHKDDLMVTFTTDCPAIVDSNGNQYDMFKLLKTLENKKVLTELDFSDCSF